MKSGVAERSVTSKAELQSNIRSRLSRSDDHGYVGSVQGVRGTTEVLKRVLVEATPDVS